MVKKKDKTEYYFSFKIFLIGKKGVGKATFIKSLYPPNSKPDLNPSSIIGVDFIRYRYPIKASTKSGFIIFQIWVFYPEDKFRFVLSNYSSNSETILIMFDVSNLTSLNEIDSWMKSIRKHNQSKNIPIMLLGNKADLSGNLKPAKALADSIVKKFGLMGYYEISALKSWNIDLIFTTIAKNILTRFP